MKILLAVLLVCFASWLALIFLAAPFVWICAGLLLLCGYASWAVRNTTNRLFWIYLGAAVLALGITEIYFGFVVTNDARQRFRVEGSRVYLKDELLGRVLPVNARWRRAVYYDDALIHDVTYSTDSRGLRVGPDPVPDNVDCVLVFGGSYTFGAGVEDSEAMPFQVERKSGRRTLNFGVNGYGPHHMLATLESGRVAEIVDCEPRHAIFQGINDHVARVTGKRSWDKQSPRYVLSDDGSPRFTGNFDDTPSEDMTLEGQLRKSHVYRRIFGADPRITEADVRLYIAIIRAAQQRLIEVYPGLSFHVIQWGTKHHEALVDLERTGIDLHYIDEILPGYDDDEVSFKLSPHDGHPSAASHERIADYVATRMMAEAVP
jgi:hypothetical protein